jgi:hypothetical protein
MHEQLVDGEGFPRADIDVYSVRYARANIIRSCLCARTCDTSARVRCQQRP